MVRRVVHGHDQVLPAASSRYGHGDSDGPGRAPSVGAELGYRTRASIPLGATLRGSPAGADEGLRPLDPHRSVSRRICIISYARDSTACRLYL